MTKDRKKFKLTIHPDIDFNGKEKLVEYFDNSDEMCDYEAGASDILLFVQNKLNIMPDRSNLFIQQELIDGEYEDIL